MITRSRLIQFAVIAIAVVIIPLQLFRNFNTSEPGVLVFSDPDEITDECIYNLFLIGEMLQQDELPEDDFKCPASDDPYIILKTEDDIIVNDPNPQLHGFQSMSVSKHDPYPKLVDLEEQLL